MDGPVCISYAQKKKTTVLPENSTTTTTEIHALGRTIHIQHCVSLTAGHGLSLCGSQLVGHEVEAQKQISIHHGRVKVGHILRPLFNDSGYLCELKSKIEKNFVSNYNYIFPLLLLFRIC